jgi:hypothetical protein
MKKILILESFHFLYKEFGFLSDLDSSNIYPVIFFGIVVLSGSRKLACSRTISIRTFQLPFN